MTVVTVIRGASSHQLVVRGIAPLTEAEVHATGRDSLIVGYTVYADFDADVRHDDQVELPAPWSGVFDVDGEIGRWENPMTGWQAGSTFRLRRAQG